MYNTNYPENLKSIKRRITIMKKFKLVVPSFVAIIFCMLLIVGSIDFSNYAGDYYFKV